MISNDQTGSGFLYQNAISRKSFNAIKKDYRFDEEDIQNLRKLIPLFEREIDRIIAGFYDLIFSFEHAKTFLYNDKIVHRHKKAIRQWFMALVNGVYDDHYYEWLAKISETHVHIGLPSHYVNCAFSFIRETLNELLIKEKYLQELPSVNKIVDINLDILSLTYKDEEHQRLMSDIVLLKRTLRSRSLEVFVQPIVDAKTKELAKFECLMRIKDPKSGRYPSIESLLKTAKNIYLYKDLMELMIEKSMQIFASNDCYFSLNIGYEDISNELFLNFLRGKILDFPRPERITFEILETDFIGDFDIIASFVDEVRNLGCTVAIDDFGSGYSSMKNIIRIQPDYVKIDGSLIEAMPESAESRTLVTNIVRMIRELGAKSVAEYVSSETIEKMVREIGVDYLQGYAIEHPFPATEIKRC